MATRDSYTWEHSAAVVWLALQSAKEIGLPEDAMTDLHDVALLHDIGKIAIPDQILRKEGPLSQIEWEIMREHPTMGAELLASVDTLRHIAPAVRAEHERWDGGGYPDGLSGEEIPIASRIVFACDAYHAMVTDRPYRKPLTTVQARDELAANAGTQFWPEATAALLAVLERSEPPDLAQVAITREPPTGRQGEPSAAFADESASVPAEAELHAEGPGEAAPERPLDLTQIRRELEEARSTAQRAEVAWRTATQQRDALRRALELLLDATRKRHGYSPRVFIARIRAEIAVRKADRPAHSGDEPE